TSRTPSDAWAAAPTVVQAATACPRPPNGSCKHHPKQRAGRSAIWRSGQLSFILISWSLLHEGAVDHLLDVGLVLLLLVGGNQVAEGAGGQDAVLHGAVDDLTAEGAVLHSLHALAHQQGVVGDLAADDALVLTQQVGGLGDVVDRDLAVGGVGLVDGLTGAGVNGGGVAEEHVGPLVHHGLGELNALVGGREGVGVDDVQGGDGLALLLARSEERRVGREWRGRWAGAEDGIRDRNVTGVQTCALPISPLAALASSMA